MKKIFIISIIISLNNILSNPPPGNAQLELFLDTKNVNNSNTYTFKCIAQSSVWDEVLEVTNETNYLESELELIGSTYNQSGLFFNGWDFITSQGGDGGLTESYGGVIGYSKYKIELESNTDHYIYVDFRNCQYPNNNCYANVLWGNDIAVIYESIGDSFKYKWKYIEGSPSDTWHTLNHGNIIIVDVCSTPPSSNCFQPTNPSNLNYTIVNNSPRLTWTASYPPNAKYNVFRDNTLIASNLSGTSYTDLTVSVPGFNQFIYKVNANLSTADTQTSPGYSNSVTVRRAQENVKILTNQCNGSPTDSGFVASDCDSTDLSVLLAFVDLNNVTPDSCNSCDYDSNGIVDPVEMGQQEWEQGRLIELNIGQYRGGFSIGQIPSQINGLSSLETLYLSYNYISSIPPSFWSIESLESLFIAGNDLNSISDSIGLLINLKELGLYSNPIETIPSSIGNLTNMQYLFLFEMELTTIPESLWNLTALVRLDLDLNQLTEIDNAIGNLEFLEELYLTQNNLTELPDSIQYMSNLSSLWIEQNFLYCVDGVQDTSLIPNWLLNNDFLVTGIYEQNCSEMVNVGEINIPENFKLHQPFPNPFNPTTTIRLSVETQHTASLHIYDITGRLVETLINDELTSGEHEIVWNAGSQPSGVYFVRLQSGEVVENQKVILLK